MQIKEPQKIWQSLPTMNQHQVLMMFGGQAIVFLNRHQAQWRSYDPDRANEKPSENTCESP